MLRISKLTDYGIMLLTYIARDPHLPLRNARELAVEAHLPLPTVSKILKILAREGLLLTHRGVNGGFSLARQPEEISVADIITALEGPLALTECSLHPPGVCQLETQCPVRSNWQKINQAVLGALKNLTLAAMACPLPRHFMTLKERRPAVANHSRASVEAHRA
jgi:FeS assembly SUF system regulator